MVCVGFLEAGDQKRTRNCAKPSKCRLLCVREGSYHSDWVTMRSAKQQNRIITKRFGSFSHTALCWNKPFATAFQFLKVMLSTKAFFPMSGSVFC